MLGWPTPPGSSSLQVRGGSQRALWLVGGAVLATRVFSHQQPVILCLVLPPSAARHPCRLISSTPCPFAGYDPPFRLAARHNEVAVLAGEAADSQPAQ
jgi:hypothetical protein